ncbi:HTH_Tnp_Tc3_2 domain-containing protein [Trichonephila clavipes]|nr:HTH_Tnp_Tc3_2 domain-containing protein [Trichonephila clavipes]
MSQRRRLPNSLRWRAVGWMEMGLSQADVARRLNVFRSVFQRLWDQYQSEDSVSRRPVPGRPRATTPAEDRYLALSARRRRTTTVPQQNPAFSLTMTQPASQGRSGKTEREPRF